jgi:hypothetical protein
MSDNSVDPNPSVNPNAILAPIVGSYPIWVWAIVLIVGYFLIKKYLK